MATDPKEKPPAAGTPSAAGPLVKKPRGRPRKPKEALVEAKPAAAAVITEEGAEPSLTEEELEKLAEVEAVREEAPVVELPAKPVKAIVRPEHRVAPRDAMQQYMRDVERHPLLTREEEYSLAVKLKETGDVDAAYRLVTANLRLVVKIAHEYRRSAFSLVDLVQEGNVGLMHAVKKFDPYRGVKLSSYSAWWIRAYILRYIMENWRMVKLGTTQAQRKLFFNLRKEQDKLVSQGFDPSPKLLAERLQVSEQDITDMDQRLSNDEFSLDVPVSADNASTRGERLSSNAMGADDRLAEHELKEMLRKRLAEFGATLKDKEQYIFEKRLISEEPLTLQQIGDRYGITRERARQIEAKLVNALREWVKQAMPDFKELEIGSPRDD